MGTERKFKPNKSNYGDGTQYASPNIEGIIPREAVIWHRDYKYYLKEAGFIMHEVIVLKALRRHSDIIR